MGERNNFLDRYQKLLLIASIVLGVMLADGIILAPIHELGHRHWASTIEGQESEIVDWNHTSVEYMTPRNLLAGYENEIVTFLLIYAALFLFSNPSTIGIRRHYFYLGLPLGYATWSWLKPLIIPVSDFTVRPEWTAAMRGTLLSEYIVWLLISWGALLIARVRIVNK